MTGSVASAGSLALGAAGGGEGAQIGLALLVGSLVLLAVGVVITIRLVRKKAQPPPPSRHVPRSDLQDLLQALLPPPLQQYLKESSSIPPEGQEPLDVDPSGDVPVALRRLQYILLQPPARGDATFGAHEAAIALAVLEARLNGVLEAVGRVESSAITQDRVVWTVLGVLGAVLAVPAAVIGIIAAMVKLM